MAVDGHCQGAGPGPVYPRCLEEGEAREPGSREGFLEAVGLEQNLPDREASAKHQIEWKREGQKGWCLGWKVRPRWSSVWKARDWEWRVPVWA